MGGGGGGAGRGASQALLYASHKTVLYVCSVAKQKQKKHWIKRVQHKRFVCAFVFHGENLIHA